MFRQVCATDQGDQVERAGALMWQSMDREMPAPRNAVGPDEKRNGGEMKVWPRGMFVLVGAFAMAAACCVLLVAPVAIASTPSTDYRERIKVTQTVQPLSERPFGEQINMYKGGLSFEQQDIELSGNGPTIALTRNYTLGGSTAGAPGKYAMADWTLSIPRIQTIVPGNLVNGEWKVASQTNGYARCTQFGGMSAAPYGATSSPYWFGKAWWFGYTLIPQDGQEMPLLRRTPENTLTQAGVTANIVTASHWMISCLPTTSNEMPGEAFLATAPDGTRYWFDALVYGPSVPTLDYEVGNSRTLLPRKLAYMYATRIEDRFGNWVTYQYTNGRPVSINASDGRQVSIQWRSDFPVVDSITVQAGSTGAMTWHYEYASATQLSRVVLPDQSVWSLSMGSPYAYDLSTSEDAMSDCGLRSGPVAELFGTVTITHPSGLTGTFDLSKVGFGRAAVPTNCSESQGLTEKIPTVYLAVALSKRTIVGPGVPSQSWQYNYSPAVGNSATECAAAPCQDQAWVEVVSPSGNVTRYTHSTRWGWTEGKLLSVISGLTSTGQSNPVGLRQTLHEYAPPSTGPYPARLGDNLDFFGGLNNNDTIEYLTPQSKTITTQQGRAFTWEVASTCGSGGASLCFDDFARPSKVTKSSASAP